MWTVRSFVKGPCVLVTACLALAGCVEAMDCLVYLPSAKYAPPDATRTVCSRRGLPAVTTSGDDLSAVDVRRAPPPTEVVPPRVTTDAEPREFPPQLQAIIEDMTGNPDLWSAADVEAFKDLGQLVESYANKVLRIPFRMYEDGYNVGQLLLAQRELVALMFNLSKSAIQRATGDSDD